MRDDLAWTAQPQTKDVSWKLFACWECRISLLYCFGICPTSCRFWATVGNQKWDPIDSRCYEERKSKEALDQTYIPARSQQARKLVGIPPMAKTKRWEESLPRGLQMQALCIGVNDYKEWRKLENAIADAEGIARCIENLPDSSARAVCRNPESKGALRREIESFLFDINKERPPQIVLIFYAGHAVQEGNQIFLLPANANPKTQEDLKSTCFSHDELFKLLKVKLDDKIEVEDVLYLVILDACRESLGGISPVLTGFSAESHEPLPRWNHNPWQGLNQNPWQGYHGIIILGKDIIILGKDYDKSARQMGAVHLHSTRQCCLRWRRRAQPVYGSANEC